MHNNKTKASVIGNTQQAISNTNNLPKTISKRWKPLAHKKELILGLLRAQNVQQQVIKKSTVQASFSGTRIYPFDPDMIYNNAKCNIPLDTRTAITATLPQLASLMAQQGELFGADIVRLTVLQLPTADARDNRVIYQRRSMIMTNNNLQQREDAKKDAAAANQATKMAGKKCGQPVGSKNKVKVVVTVPM